MRNRSGSLLLALCLSSASAIAIAEDLPWAEKTVSLSAIGEIPSGVLDKAELDRLTDIGEALFAAKFTELDGVGRPEATQAIVPTRAKRPPETLFSRMSGSDANSCAACHNDPAPGGAGDFVTNVFVSEGFNNADFDTSDPQFSNERGTNHLFGAGLLELLAREMSAELQLQRGEALRAARQSGEAKRVVLETKGVPFGHLTAMPDGVVNLDEVAGVDADLVIRPFSQKGVMTSLRQFTVNAMNHHHGMQADERFGVRWTGLGDFDEDGVENELSDAAISALVAWQATLPAPIRKVPESQDWQAAAEEGLENMRQLGCTSCHRETLPLDSLAFADPGPVDVSGTLNVRDVGEPAIYDLGHREWAASLARDDEGRVLVPLFGDLKRHQMTDPANEKLGNELLSQRFVDRTIFMTSELWGAGSTAPYGHRNDFHSLDAIIRAHGGDARQSKERYEAAEESERSAIIAFLKTLVIEP